MMSVSTSLDLSASKFKSSNDLFRPKGPTYLYYSFVTKILIESVISTKLLLRKLLWSDCLGLLCPS